MNEPQHAAAAPGKLTMVRHYIREANQFTDNAAAGLL
jgi:hypothetical protein